MDSPNFTSARAPAGDSAGSRSQGMDASLSAATPLQNGLWQRLLGIANHPNGLTLTRIALIPFIILFFSFPEIPFFCLTAAIVFAIAALTDWYDGFLARRQGKVTFMGIALDPVADKLLTCSAFIMLAAHGWVPAWMVCLIVGRELAVTGLRSVLAGRGLDISASHLGKLKTGFQIAAIIPLMIHYPFLGLDTQLIGWSLLWPALGFTVWSGADYFLKFKRAI